MNLFELFVKIGVDDQASSNLSKISGKLGDGLKTAAKVGLAAVGAAAAGITALTTQAVNSFAEYEQLAGGAAKIFDEMSQTKILDDARNAYKELGLSMNEYLAVINDVGATFAQTMGDEAGYEAARKGLQAISDYASGTGKNVDVLSDKFTMITRSTASYQSIADQFSGILPATSAGFLEQAQAAGILSDKYKQLTEVPIDEYQAAVSQMLQQGVSDLGLANNTMNEAFSTLSGSLSMAKGAWSNLVAGLADENANLGVLVDNVIQSAFTVVDNILPRIEQALPSVATAITTAIPPLIQKISEVIDTALPTIIESAISIIDTLIQAISDNKDMLANSAITIIMQLTTGILEMLPEIIALGLDLIISLANGIAESLPELIPTIVDVVLQIVDTLTDPETLSSLIDASIAIIIALAEGLINSLPKLLEKAPTIISNFVTAIVNNAPKLLTAAAEVIKKLAVGIINNLPQIGQTAGEIIGTLFNGIVSYYSELWSIGSNIVSGIWNGIVDNFDVFYENVKGFFSGIINGVKNILGIHSPSRVFAGIGENMALGLGEGWDDEFGNIKKDIQNGMNFGVATVGVDSSVISRNNSGDVSYGIDKPITIIVQSVLDGKVIGETAYNYNRRRARAGGT